MIKNIKNSIKIFVIITIIASAMLPVKDAQALFKFTVNGRKIDFGPMKIGQWKELSEEGSYHNEIVCQSDKGDRWYLKIHLLMPFESGENQLEPSSFRWRVVEVQNGNGVITNEGRFNDFTLAPNVVYISGPDDSNGGQVKIRFSYGLEIPKGAITGNYRAYIRYTLTETL